MAKAKRDIKQEVTDKIVSALEEGTAPWVKSWSGGRALGLPSNISTGKGYRGVNVMLLYIAADENGFGSDEWMTYKQAEGMGAQVRGGSKGTRIIFWNILTKEDKDGNEKKIPLLRGYTVFNRDQIDGLAEVDVTEEPSEAERHQRADDLIASTGASVSYGASAAFYRPSSDSIAMPAIEQFDAESEYYSTHLHELAHWTGHASRLDRDLVGGFGTEKYGNEELVAELAAAFLCATIGIEGKLQHAEYIAGWIKNLKADKGLIFSAVSKATKAADYLVAFEATEVIAEAA